MAIVYSTTDVHPRDAAAYWGEVVTRNFYNSFRSNDKDRPFKASLCAGQIGFLGVTSYECSPYSGERTELEIARADSDDYFISLHLSGCVVHTDSRRDATLKPGSFFLMDPTEPFENRLKEPSRVVVIKVPRARIDERLGRAGDLTTRAFDTQNPITALMFGFLAMLPERMDALDNVAGAKIADQAFDLMVLAITTELKSGNMSLPSQRAATLTMLKLAVDTRLRDPAFKPAAAAAAAGISVRYANALLAEENMCLEQYIIARRLDQCRKALEDPTQAHRTISEIAFGWGFADMSHFGRRFKAAYGCAPGEYRKVPRVIKFADSSIY